MERSPVMSNIMILVSFFSVVLFLAQEEALDISLLHGVQTLFCWPSFFECVIFTVCLWFFRDFERILGRSSYLFLIHSFLAFLPFFVIMLIYQGFKYHFSLILFVPYSLFVFMMWNSCREQS